MATRLRRKTGNKEREYRQNLAGCPTSNLDFPTWQGLESPWKHVSGCFQKDLTEEGSVGGPISWTRSQGGVKVRVFPERQHLLPCFQAVHASPSFLHSFPTMI